MVSMEDRCLNFTQPILSVRRGSSTTTAIPQVHKSKTNNNVSSSSNIPPLPYYKSDIKSGPIRNPGVVPFQWEQSPGRPKHDKTTQSQQTRAIVQPAGVAPKVPSGSVLNQSSDKSAEDSHAFNPQLECDSASISDISSLQKNNPEEENSSSGSGDDNLTYQDALETLSRSDSFLNCSLSDLSGLDRPGMRPPSGTGSNPMAQDFMMDRFLTAAKAVASDTAQLGSRKPQHQPVCKEEPVADVKKIIIKNNGNPGNHCIPESYMAYPNPYNGVEEEEDDDDYKSNDDDDDFEGTGDFSSAKLCGLLPRFCLLNPLPGGMRYPAPTPGSSVQKIHRKPANVGAHMKNEAKAIIDAVHEKKRLTVYQRSDMRVNDGSNTVNNELKKVPFQLVAPSMSAVNCSGEDGNNIAPYRSTTRHSLMQKERGLLGVPEVPRSSWPVKRTYAHRNARLRQLLAPDQSQSIREEPSSHPHHAVVKTLYIDDSAQGGAEYQDSYSSSSESRSHTESRGRNPSIDYSLLQDVNDLSSADDKAISQLRSSAAIVNSSAQHEKETSDERMEKRPKDFSRMQDKVEPVSSRGGINLQGGSGFVQQSKKEELAMQDKNSILPLPLPKSPSESWLSRARAVPSAASSRTTHLKTYLGLWNQCSRDSPVHPKWENVVRSSDSNHKQLAVPMLTPISEN